MRKVYVEVTADFTADGQILPRSFRWEDGHSYEIDRIMDIRKAASLKVGGIGDRYAIKVRGKETFIWLENDVNKWFMEGRDK